MEINAFIDDDATRRELLTATGMLVIGPEMLAEQDKVHVHDFHATVLHLLGIDHERLTYRYGGRDFRLTDVEGNVVQDLFA